MSRWESTDGKSQRRGAEPTGRMRDEKLHGIVVRRSFRSQKAEKPHVQSTFGSWDVEKVRIVVAQSTWSQDVKKHLRFGTLWEVEMSKKCAPLWREAHFQIKMCKTLCWEHFWKLRCRKSVCSCGAKHISTTCTKHIILGTLFEVRMWFCVAGARDSAPCQKWGRREGFLTFPKTMARVGHSKEDLQRCISRGRRSTRDMFIRDVRRSGRWFHERGCILEHRIFRPAKANLRDRCSTSYDLASFFRGRRNIVDRWNKNPKTHWCEASSFALNFHFWRNSCRLASFLTLSR